MTAWQQIKQKLISINAEKGLEVLNDDILLEHQTNMYHSLFLGFYDTQRMTVEEFVELLEQANNLLNNKTR